MLEIRDLHTVVDGKPILRGVNLKIVAGEVHAVMGPNGSGKSTLAYVLAGREGYQADRGEVLYDGKMLLELTPEERARAGLFLAFQYPVEIPGVANATFLRTAVNAARSARGEEELSAMAFLKEARTKLKQLRMDESFLNRQVNVGFSGGEKKRFEILQMLILKPKLIILDETDSGLDIDALKIVSQGINSFRTKNNAFILITHYHRILKYLKPDFVHVLSDGKIIKSGDEKLALKIEERGYNWLK